MNFMQEYNKGLEKELTQFLFLCGKEDGLILISDVNESEISEHVRLACIAIVFGYKKVFMKIVAHAEKYFDEFMKELKNASENFLKIDGWINEFIKKINYPDAQNLMLEFWNEQKRTLNPFGFDFRQLLN
ncbi:MAG: hypothetical protein NC033_04575 [Clostridiales bacterium]|nr:hypothetical protein [Clostridiales bacterium]